MTELQRLRDCLPLRGRLTVWLALIVAGTVFVTIIPNAWATPNEAPLNQTMPTVPTVPTIPPAPAPPAPDGGGGDNGGPVPPPRIPYGGHLYYYVLGYGGTPSGYYPGYTTGGYQYGQSGGIYYPGGYYWSAPPVYQGYGPTYYGTFW